MDAQERAWLAQYRAGDVEALAHLVERYRRPLFGFIHNMTEGRGDPEGIFQETWIRAIQKLPDFRDDNLMGWLYRTARNLVIDQFRKNRFRAEMPVSDDERESNWVERIADAQPGPDRTVAGRELGVRIRQALSQLPREQREVFLMRMQGDVPFREIASIQRVSLNTALGRMHYAVRRLRDLLKDEYSVWTGNES
ncbi:MAG: sigma-70 family RNA polymerase sigma factor [Kiritimatiellia bacterium]|nr:sigma-70 family RNA polymerase sigma factor [Kiritimatiellia bacterium]